MQMQSSHGKMRKLGGGKHNVRRAVAAVCEMLETRQLLSIPAASSSLSAMPSSSAIDVAWVDNSNNETDSATPQAGSISGTATATVVTAAIPNAPSNLTVQWNGNNDWFHLTWTDNSSDETGFVIDWATWPDFTHDFGSETVAANTTSYNWAGSPFISYNAAYYFRVRATGTGGSSAYSQSVNATALHQGPPVPAAPTNITTTVLSQTQIQLIWTDNSNGMYAETAFLIERSTSSNFAANYVRSSVGQNVTTFTDSGLTSATTYYYRVRAANDYPAWSAAATPVSATTLSDNRPPTDISLSSSSIAENQPSGTTVGTLGTTDPDSGNTFTYTLVSGSGSTDNGSFTISGNQLKTAAAFDYEAKSSYSIRVRTTDQGGLWFEKPFTVTVTNVNETPTDITLSPSSIAEHRPVGTTVGTLGTTDPDTGNTFTYSLVSGTGSTDNSSFSISGNQLLAAASFDYETKNSYSIRVRTADQGGLWFERAFTIAITDVTEVFVAAPSDLTAAFDDTNQPRLDWMDNSNNETGFRLERATDSSFTQILRATIFGADGVACSIDLVSPGTTYFFRICAIGPTGNSSWSNTASIAIPWSWPSAPSGLTATAVSQTQINLAWIDNSGDETGFYIDRATNSGFTTGLATISVAANVQSYSATGLTAATTYYFRVRACNMWGSSANTSTASATTLSGSTNQTPTDITLTPASIAENQPSGTAVGTFTTTDPDTGDTFTYSLVSGTGSTDNASFTINGNQLLAAASFDHEARSSYSIRVRTTDQGGLSFEKPFTITVTNVNEAPVVYDIPINTTENTSVSFQPTDFTSHFTDVDGDVLQKIRITSLPASGSLQLNSVSVTLNQEIATADLANLTYTPVSGFGFTVTFGWNGWDGATYATTAALVRITVNQWVPLPDITATPTAGGDPWANTPGDVAFGLDGGSPMDMSYSGGAVRYGDGREYYTSSDLDPAEATLLSGLTRTWSSDPQRNAINQGLGSGWFISQWPMLVQSGSSIKAVDGGTSIRWFDLSGGNYVQRFFGRDKLVQGSDYLYLTDTAGNCTKYFRFDYSEVAQRGMPYQYIDAAGNVTQFHYAQGRLDRIERWLGSAEQILENTSLVWVNGKVQSAVVTRYDANGQDHFTAAAEYGYTGELLTHVTIYGVDDQPIDEKQYWYDANGRLRTVLEGDSYQRAVGANISINSTTNSETQVASYADLRFTFDDSGHLRQQIMQGMGQYDYEYFASSFADGINNWRYRTIEYLPDGLNDGLANNDRRIVYSNYAGEVLVTVSQDYNASGVLGQQWITGYEYDANGRLIAEAQPSAMNLGAFSEANAQIAISAMRTSEGLIYVHEYYTAAAGDKEGYLFREGVKQGHSGVVNAITQYDYSQKRPATQTYLVSSLTSFTGTGGSGGVTTSYSYTFQGDAILQRTTTLPAVAEAQNGANTTATEVEQYDSLGHLRWTKDADGFIGYFAYDPATGALTRSIVDVNTTQTADFASLPTGWATPSGGGLHLKTDFLVDSLGRMRQTTDPMSHVTTVTYTETETWTEFRTRYPDAGSGMASPPDQIVRHNRTLGEVDTLTLAHGATGTANVLSLTMSFYNLQGQLEAVQRYDATSGIHYDQQLGGLSGTMGGSCYRTQYHYDAQGRQDEVTAGRDHYLDSIAATNPTITKTVYDALGRVASTWIGTTDANLVKVSENEYDDPSDTLPGGGVGDSTLTKVTLFPGGTEANRVTRNLYDWRNQLVLSETGVGATAGVHPPITFQEYDNLGRAIGQRIYDGEGIAFNSLVPETVTTTLSGVLCAYTQTFYDDRGRTYKTLQHDINQSTAALATDFWYNNRNQVIKTRAPGGLITKTQYDGAGRVSKQSTTDGGGDPAPGVTGNYAAADDLVGDAVLEQVLYQYDQNGNVRLVTTKQRNHDSTLLGDLSDGDARISFVGNWYDGADRLIASINYGNNGNNQLVNSTSGRNISTDLSATTQPGVDTDATNGWDRWLQTSYQYDTAGNLAIMTDPRSIQTRTYYDALGRKTWVIEAYTGSLATTDPALEADPGPDTDRKLQYEYNGFNQVTTQTSWTYKPGTGINQQHTWYLYGVQQGAGIAVSRSDLLRAVTYEQVPDDPQAQPPLPDVVDMGVDQDLITGYNALGEITQRVQRNHTTHNQTHDVLGRQTSDYWFFTDANDPAEPFIDTWADERRVQYDALGRGVVLSMLNSGSVVNQVQRVFDGLGNLVTEYQEHNGSVTSSTPSVQYSYQTDFIQNYSRLSHIIYPDERTISYEYGYFGDATPASFLSALNNAISRVGAVSDTATPTASTRLEVCDYLGTGTIVRREYENVLKDYYSGPETASTGMSYLASDTDGLVFDDAGASDEYDGLDRFGRVVFQNWYTGGNPYGTDGKLMGYDADGNLLYTRMVSNSIYQKWRSEIYHLQGATADTAYDQLNRPKGFFRGEMLAGNRTVNQGLILAYPPDQYIPTQYMRVTEQLWDVNTTGDYDQGTSSDVEPINKGRTFQKARPSTTQVFNLGGMLTDPRRDVFLTYDAWGQLVTQSAASFQWVSGTNYTYTRPFDNQYRYDALGRCISEQATNRNGAIEATDLYYDASGKILQENNSTLPEPIQYVYSAQGGTTILRDDVDRGNLTPRRVWCMQGPDLSVWSLYEPGNWIGHGRLERISYTQTGLATFLNPVNYGDAYAFGDFSTFDWRQTWRGGRVARDQDLAVYGTGITDRQSGLMMVHGQAYDSLTGSPLAQDPYAIFRTGNGSSDINSHAYSTRGNVNSQFPFSGTAVRYDLIWEANNPLVMLGNMFGGDIAWMSTFTTSFLDEVGGRAAGMAQGAWNTVRHPINTFNSVVDTTSSFIANGWADRDSAGWGSWSNYGMSAWEGAGYLVGSATGLRQIGEAAYGVDITSRQEISSLERWTRGSAGVGQLLLTAAGSAGAYNPALTSFRGGGAAWSMLQRLRAGTSPLRSYGLGFVDRYVRGTLSGEQLHAVRLIAKAHPSLQREGFGGLGFIDTGASVTKYAEESHGLLIKAAEGAVPRGVLAEELQHAIDYASGLHSPQRIAAMRTLYGTNFNTIWHQGVFNRIADALESSQTSIFHFFLSPDDAAAFRQAAVDLGSRLQ